MRIEKTGEGRTVAEATAEAKALLGAPEDAELHVDVISDSKKKMFGLKFEPAKVCVWYEAPDAEPAPEQQPAKPAPKVKPAPAEKPAPKADVPPARPRKAAQSAPAKEETEERQDTEVQPAQTPEAGVTQLEIKSDDPIAAYLRAIVEGIGVTDYELSLELDEAEKEYVYRITSADDGVLIGRKGETLDSIQYLVRLFVNKGFAEDKHRKVTVNAGNYREKRKETLEALVRKNARQVRKYGRPFTFEPMNPYERRILHTACQSIEGVTSESVGVDDARRVVLSLEEGVEPLNPGRGGGRDRDSRGRGGYGGRGGNRGGRGGQRREPYKPAVTREPRKDSAGSLYGRIDIPGND